MPRQTEVAISTRLTEEQLQIILALGGGRSKSAIVLEALEEWCRTRGAELPKVALTPPGKRPGAGRKPRQ